MAINDRLKPVAELLETNRQKIDLMISHGMASDLAIQKR
jgi:aconitase B